MNNAKGRHAPCPYFSAPSKAVCGSELCRLNQSVTGSGGVIVTCGGVNIPGLRQCEAVMQGGDRYDVWLRGGSRA